MLDLTDLSAFSVIADLGSISAAARTMKTPKSSISRSLSRLEAAIGVVLIERSTRHLRLTDAGLLLKQHARRILDDVGEAEDAISGLIGKPSGELNVNAPFTFASGPLASMLPSFIERFPEVKVILTVDNRLTDLQMERIDVAIRIGPLQDSALVARRIATFELWACAGTGYAKNAPSTRTLSDLRDHKLIAHADLQETWHFRSISGALQSVDVECATVIPEPNVLKTMLIGGAGIGLLPDFHAADAVADGRLIRLFPELRGLSVDAHALYPSHRSLSAKVRVFIDALVAYLGPTT